MPKKFYLMSGHSSTGRLKPIDRTALNDVDNKNVLILNLTWSDKEKLKSKGDFFREYFHELGAETVDVVEDEASEEQIGEGFEKAGLIYLPGGDTRTLIGNIRKKGLDLLISNFEGVVSGNSAGTYSLCPEYLRIRNNKIEDIIPAMGLVPFCTKAHYEPKFDPLLRELSKEREIYALQDESAVVYDGGFNFIGNIWKFYRGYKERIN